MTTASASMAEVRYAMESMTEKDMNKVVQYAAQLRNARNCLHRLLLRNRICRLCIVPETVDNHQKKNRAPAQLKVNRQILTEFAGIYYSHENVQVERWQAVMRIWETVKDDPELMRAMLVSSMTKDHGAHVYWGLGDIVAQVKEIPRKARRASSGAPIKTRQRRVSTIPWGSRTALISWSDGESTSVAVCKVWPESEKIKDNNGKASSKETST